MTVELGAFGALQTNLGDDQLAVLVETKRDWIQETERTGLVLHHPGLADASPEQSIFRLGAEVVDRLQVLRQLEVGRRTRRGLLPPGGQSDSDNSPFSWGLDRDYQDPVGGRYAGTWLAAFEPVIVNEGSDALGDTGWIVIVQERMD